MGRLCSRREYHRLLVKSMRSIVQERDTHHHMATAEGRRVEKEGGGGDKRKTTHVTQMVKHRALPMNAMMLSNAGKRIEMARKTSTAATRMATLATPRK